jgi:FAD/FMN-containing dehydrogenase
VEVRDWTGRFAAEAVGVVRPRSVAEVAQALASGYAVTTRGGNTGLVGGAVPATSRPTLMLDTTLLTGMGPVDDRSGQVTVGAGVPLAQVQAHAEAAGWTYGIDLAARDSATIGGTVATNAGGIRVVRYGMTRAQVVGVQAVLADGSVVDEARGLLKDNTGYSLSGLLCGSEGTLGVITAVRLALHRPPRAPSLGVVPVPSLDAALDVVAAVRRTGAELLAAEVVDAASLALLGESVRGWRLFIEVADGGAAEGLGALPDDAEVGLDAAARRRLWAVREGMTELWGRAAAQAGTVVQKYDVSVPMVGLDPFVAHMRGLLGDRVGVFGHVADGNLHLEVVDPDREWDEEVLTLVARAGGSVSAEHGIGVAKRPWLGLTRSAAEIAAMRAIKAALDPRGILNPGVLLDP